MNNKITFTRKSTNKGIDSSEKMECAVLPISNPSPFLTDKILKKLEEKVPQIIEDEINLFDMI